MTKTRNNDKALAAFFAHKAEIDTMLARLQEASDNHFGFFPDEVTWGHVGSLEYYRERLKQITDAVYKEGEYAA